jgi:hypothetical protein
MSLVYVVNGGIAVLSADPTVGIPSLPLVITQAMDVIDQGSGDFDGAIAPSGHVNGGQLRIRFPANQRTSVTWPTAPPVRGDQIDATKDQIHVLERVHGTTIITVITDTRDTAAVSVVSATIVTGLSSLVVVFSKAVWIQDLTGLSLTYSVGGPNSIVAIASGNGTSVVTFTLLNTSGASDAGSFVYGGTNTIYDRAGVNHLASGSTALTQSDWLMPGARHRWRGDHATVGAGTVSAITDSVGSATMTSSATQPTAVTVGTQNRVGWAYVTGSYLKTATGLAETMTSGAHFFVTSVTDTATEAVIVNGGETGSNLNWICTAQDFGGVLRFDLDRGQSGPVSGGTITTALTDWLVTWGPTSREIYMNGSLVASVSGALAPEATVDRWVIGVLADLTSLPASAIGLKTYEHQIGNAHLSAGDATSAHVYRTTYYI